VRLTYRDGSTAEGIWQDGTRFRGDGTVHSHTSGQVRLLMIDQAEQWRPGRRRCRLGRRLYLWLSRQLLDARTT
jgi:hypothetical protein